MQVLSILLIVLGAIMPASSHAYFTLENFSLSGEHPAPKSFTTDGAGGFWGVTTDNRLFTQRPIINDQGIKLHKFTIDDAYFYISDRGVFLAHSDLVALSIYYSLG